LLLGELVCYVVRRRSRIKEWDERTFHTLRECWLCVYVPSMEHSEVEIKISKIPIARLTALGVRM